MRSEYRQDPITKKWTVISPDRELRPKKFVVKETKTSQIHRSCVFCEGAEKMTPKEVYAVRHVDTKPDTSGWTVRVVPNKFPAFFPEAHNGSKEKTRFFQSMPAIGGHEVVITRHRNKDIGQFSEHQAKELIEVYVKRFLALKHNPKMKARYVLVTQNHGRKAGASIPHPHSQIFAFSNYEGSKIEHELMGARDHWVRKRKCIFCAIIANEIKAQKRIVWKNNRFLVYCPYAASYPFEMWIVPRKHSAFFEQSKEEDKAAVAEALRIALGKLYKGLKNPDYNFYIHTGPTKFISSYEEEEVSKYYHWHLRIVPRLTVWGGFEMGTDMIINAAPPEDSAKFLRSIKG